MTHLFVYGSLKQGYPLHHYLTESILSGSCSTAPGYAMYSCGSFPCMIRDPENWIGVHGELYEVESGVLDAIDFVEGHPTMFAREEIVLSDGQTAQAYIYQNPIDHMIHYPEGVWSG